MKKLLITLLVAAVLVASVVTVWAYVDDVISVLGTFGAPTALSSDPAVAEPLVIAADQQFIQISDNSIITMHLDPPIIVDSSTATSDMILDTYDQPFPGAAKIEVRQDGSEWVNVPGRALNDCNVVRQYVFDDLDPGAYVDLTQTGLSQVNYVRLTDYPGSIDGEFIYPLLGFDLDAIDEAHQRFQDCQPVTVIEVDIDIKPGSDPNCFNINGHGVIPVAILGSADFDVSQIDPSTLMFGGLEVRVKGKGTPQCSVEDVSGDFTYPEGAPDGEPDLVCQFVDNSELWVPDNSTATLTGELLDGTPFEGGDEICIVP
jgi:hypothetical protein